MMMKIIVALNVALVVFVLGINYFVITKYNNELGLMKADINNVSNKLNVDSDVNARVKNLENTLLSLSSSLNKKDNKAVAVKKESDSSGMMNEMLQDSSQPEKNAVEVIDDLWKKYTNDAFGFSILFPNVKQDIDNECGEYRITESSSFIKIGSKKCEGWKIYLAKAENDSEIENELGKVWGDNQSSCKIVDKKLLDDNKILDINIDRRPGGLSTCRTTGSYSVLYSEDTQTLIFWSKGQDYSFTLSDGNYADELMEKSLRFIK